MEEAVRKAAEFYLERRMHVQGDHYEPWYRFHYPVHYYYDLLVGLEFMTAFGYARDKRLGHAIEVLKKKRRKDGSWILVFGTPRCRRRGWRVLCKASQAGADTVLTRKGGRAK